MAQEARNCPYCGIVLKAPYWRHIESKHPEEYQSDKSTWLQLFQDYISMGMDKDKSIQIISEIFNRDTKIIEAFLKKSGKF